MVKCRICGKQFQSISSLREHHRAVHPNQRYIPPKPRITKTLLALFVVILIATSGVVGYLIYQQAQKNVSRNSGILNSPISPSLYDDLTNVSDSTLSSIGYQQSGVTPPSAISGGQSSQLLYQDKPEVLFIGAEWCPFCAAERWSLVLALSKFGNFSGLEYMLSAVSDGNISTLTFLNATYKSQYISFVSVEHEDRNHNELQPVSADEQNLWNAYTSSIQIDAYPFIYIDSQYYLAGGQIDYEWLSGLSWTQIGSSLNNPNSTTAKLIDGAANQLIGAICSALQSRNWPEPTSVCSQSFANVSYSDRSGNSITESEDSIFVQALVMSHEEDI